MKIQSGCIVELEYELRDDDGDVVESSEEGGPLTYLHGNDEIPNAVEARLEGAEVGAEVEVTLGPGEAYGEFNPDGIVSVPRDQFPPDAEIVPGDWIEVELQREEGDVAAEAVPGVPALPEETTGAEGEGEEGEAAEDGSMQMRVVEISPDAIVLDANHPLAGKQVTFDLKVVSVRTASAEEIEERSQEGEED